MISVLLIMFSVDGVGSSGYFVQGHSAAVFRILRTSMLLTGLPVPKFFVNMFIDK